MSLFPDPRARSPSTGRWIRRGILLVAGLTIASWLVGRLRSGTEHTLFRHLGFGILLAYADLVVTYAKPRWRQAVAPHQALGLGVAGLIVALVAVGTGTGDAAPAAPWLWLGASVVTTALPTTLIVLAIREMD